MNLTNGLTRDSVFVDEQYLGKLSEDLRVRVELKYDNWDVRPATGVSIYIISTKCGSVDSYQINFDRFWGGDSENHYYWLCKNRGWYKAAPTIVQMATLAREIDKIVSMYKEEYY